MLRVGGIVLCGGQSKRMGQPKAWLPFAGELLLPRIIRRLSEAVTPVVVVAAANQDVPPLPTEVAIVRDEEKNRGPLEGLRVGLQALHDRCDAAFLSGCDAPFMSPAFVHRLIDLLDAHDICVPDSGGYLHPLAAVYRMSVREVIPRLLESNRLRPVYLFDEVPTRLVASGELSAVDPLSRSLWNLNTPEDYKQALAHNAATS